jgi:hypothetical protein
MSNDSTSAGVSVTATGTPPTSPGTDTLEAEKGSIAALFLTARKPNPSAWRVTPTERTRGSAAKSVPTASSSLSTAFAKGTPMDFSFRVGCAAGWRPVRVRSAD